MAGYVCLYSNINGYVCLEEWLNLIKIWLF